MKWDEYDNPGNRYLFIYDDPYKMLATHLISSLPLSLLKRFMIDDEYVLQLITHEVQDVEMAAPFLDCAQDVLFRRHQKVKFKQAQAAFATFIYKELDIKYLRKVIRDFLLSCGIDLLAG